MPGIIFLTTRRLNQKFIYSGSEQIDWHYPVELGYYNLDDTDSKILGAISSDARLPLVDIAKAAGVDAKVVKYRLKKLENDGIVLAYVTAPNFEKLGLQFIQINISLVDPSIRSEIIHYFDSTNKCLYAMEMIGKYDLAIELHVQTNQELKAILDGFRKKYSEKIGSYDLSTINHEYVVEWGPFKAKD